MNSLLWTLIAYLVWMCKVFVVDCLGSIYIHAFRRRFGDDIETKSFLKMVQVRARLNEVQRAIAIGQLQAEKKQSDVVRAMGVSQHAIRALSWKFRPNGIVEKLPRSGRPRSSDGARRPQGEHIF